MKIQDFNERLKDSILIADGAMGSMLHEAVGSVRCFDELNTSEPEAVFRIHQSYIEAGAQIIETNTFGANRFKLAPLGLGDEVPSVKNHATWPLLASKILRAIGLAGQGERRKDQDDFPSGIVFKNFCQVARRRRSS